MLYGYLPDRDSGKLKFVVDAETAPIVQRIFQLCLNGLGPTQIAKLLTAENILSPGAYGYRRTGKRTTERRINTPCRWDTSAVAHILANRAYTGCTVNGKTYRPSFNSKYTVKNPESEQIIIPNMHEAINDGETFELVQKRREQRRWPTKNGRDGYFLRPGLLCRLRAKDVPCEGHHHEA